MSEAMKTSMHMPLFSPRGSATNHEREMRGWESHHQTGKSLPIMTYGGAFSELIRGRDGWG